ncbi:DUF6265 family protein [Flavobacteriaceae bacterium M23B6Z8]
MKKLAILVMMFSLGNIFAQREKTISIDENEDREQISIDQLSWISGHWKGEAFGGVAEEIWSPPEAGSMMFVFRHIVDGKVTFYEAGAIMETPEGLILRFKHFHGDMKGWEKKDETVDFKFIKLENNIAYFNDFTFEKISDTEMNIYVMISEEKTKPVEVKFNYKKQ